MTGRKILDDVTWLIGPGDRFGIVGANGAGKSTLLKIIAPITSGIREAIRSTRRRFTSSGTSSFKCSAE